MVRIGLALSVYNEYEAMKRWAKEPNTKHFDRVAIGVDDENTQAIVIPHEVTTLYRFTLTNFADMVNAGIEHLQDCDWILQMAPDEYFEGIEHVRELAEEGERRGIELFLLPRYSWADLERKEPVANLGDPDDWQPRLFKKHIRFHGAVHEWPGNATFVERSRRITIHHYAPYYEKMDPERARHKRELYSSLMEV
jgi:hypothetical protein